MYHYLLIIICFYGCSKSIMLDIEDYNSISSIEIIDQISVRELEQYWSNPIANDFISYDLDVLRIVYYSETDRKIASGAILIPKTNDIKGIISLQHATFFGDEEAPSENGSFSVVSRKSIFASHGYIVVLPDYFGYGVDKERIHPYHHAATLSMASRDMLRATLEYLDKNSITYQKKIFLAGYSEGAYATAAFQKYIEESGEWEITGSSLGAGAYNLLQTVDTFIAVETLDNDCLPCNAFFLQAYNDQYDLKRNMSYYFKEPYDALIENGLLLGTYSGEEVNAAFPEDPNELYNSEFIKSYGNEGEVELKMAFQENSIQEWRVQSPTIIMHGQNDNVVPYFNSAQLHDNNMDNQYVNFKELVSSDHFAGIFEWGIITMEYFDQF